MKVTIDSQVKFNLAVLINNNSIKKTIFLVIFKLL